LSILTSESDFFFNFKFFYLLYRLNKFKWNFKKLKKNLLFINKKLKKNALTPEYKKNYLFILFRGEIILFNLLFLFIKWVA
jgi:hypothetical protein